MSSLHSGLLAKLQERHSLVGFAHMIQDLALTETLRNSDFDFLTIDMQHIAITVETLQHVLIALQPTALSVLVRPLWNDPRMIGQILDVGADAVIVPMVNSATEAKRAVAAARYPPDGTRSWGPRRTSWIGDSTEYARRANASIAVFTQVETAEAVENLDEILAVPGLAGVMVGPSDLAISLGYGDDRNNSAVINVIQQVLDRCLEMNLVFGFFAGNADQGRYWLERGARLVTCSSDLSFVASGATELASSLRSSTNDSSGPGPLSGPGLVATRRQD